MQPAGHGADDGVPIVVPLKNSGIQEAEKEVVNQSAHQPFLILFPRIVRKPSSRFVSVLHES
jgi:hypothetical protein